LNCNKWAWATLLSPILRQSLARIQQRPDSFSPLETLPASSGYRRLIMPVFRYLVIYQQAAEDIIIVAISHPSREPNYWLGRK
jgi:plasmid stabilization system protein ParE